MRPVLLLSTSRETGEMQELLISLGCSRIEVLNQPRTKPNPATYFGRGKIGEARQALDRLRDPLVSGGVPLVVVNTELRPPQLFNLEEALGAEVWDRVRVILEIFRSKAEIKEARLQVELARLRYELPFVHEALHRRLTGERPGFMGGGEVEARTYETHLKRRTKTIQQDLERIRRERTTRRAGRRKGGFALVAIAGYTNSGKSSLLNMLCASDALVEDKVFSTLQTKTRRLRRELLPRRPYNLLFTDTVGFIRDLPPWLVDAFASTLEEITFADVVGLVVDASESPDVISLKIRTVVDLLREIHAPERMVFLFNKADLLGTREREGVQVYHQLQPFLKKYPYVFTSAKTGENLQRFIGLLLGEVLPSRRVRLRLNTSRPDQIRFLHWVYDHADVLSNHTDATQQIIEVRCGMESWGAFLREARKVDVPVHPHDSTGNQRGPSEL